MEHQRKQGNWLTFLFIFISLVGMIMIWITSKNYGVGYTPDSIFYTSVADNLSKGLGFLTFENEPLVLWPPFYPVVLSMGNIIFGFDSQLSARVLNTLLFGLNLFFSCKIFYKTFSSVAFTIWGVFLVMVSFPLVEMALFAFSETLFITLIIFYLFFLEKHSKNHNVWWLIAFSISVSLLCMTRYIGGIFIFSGALSLYFIKYGKFREWALKIITFLAISGTPIVLWLGRNYLITNSFSGERYPSSHSLLENINLTVYGLLYLFIPGKLLNDTVVIAVEIILLLIFFLFLFLVFKKRIHFASINIFQWASVLVIAGYLSFLIISSTTTGYNYIEARLLSPMVIPLIILMISIFQWGYTKLLQKLPKSLVNWLFILCFLLSIFKPVRSTIMMTTTHFSQGGGLTGHYWAQNETIRYTKENELDCVLYSNGPYPLNFYSGLEINSVPYHVVEEREAVADFSSLEEKWANQSRVCLIWFENGFWQEPPTNFIGLEEIITLEDGKIFIINHE